VANDTSLHPPAQNKLLRKSIPLVDRSFHSLPNPAAERLVSAFELEADQ